jgi:hypothetical protein
MAKENVRDAFKSRQLVLTTVPTDSPVILARGADPLRGDDYRWIVEMPVIMTYITNNNVLRRSHAIIRLTITRSPISMDNIRGVAIKTWQIGGS